jgi:hypothetical protein
MGLSVAVSGNGGKERKTRMRIGGGVILFGRIGVYLQASAGQLDVQVVYQLFL